MKKFQEAEVEGKNVVLRSDLNLPVEDGKPRPTVRFEEYMKALQKLHDKDAITVVLAHQGRPARQDFISLEEHAELISKYLDTDVRFVRSFFGSELGETIEEMENGDIALVENMRFLSEELQNVPPEEHATDYFVKNSSEYFDLFVNDAFSAAHRSHGSIVGFNPRMESYAGPLMTRELENCRKVRDELEKPLLVLGGEKPSDLIGMLEQMIERADKVLLGGIPGELALELEGYDIGKKTDWIEENGLDEKAGKLEDMLEKHRDKFVLPEDVRTDSGNHSVEEIPKEDMTWDIGEETAEKFRDEIKDADSIMMKGPMGAFEDHPEGTRAVVDAIAETDGFTVLGGGHTSSLVKRFDREMAEFSHVSIAGGAFVRYMSGQSLAAVEALEKYG